MISDALGFGAGDRVDILLTRKPDQQSVSGVIVQNIAVLAIARLSDADNPALPRLTVTVAVDIVQAHKLALAQQVGRLSLLVRGSGPPRDHKRPRPPEPDLQPPRGGYIPPVFRIPGDEDLIRRGTPGAPNNPRIRLRKP